MINIFSIECNQVELKVIFIVNNLEGWALKGCVCCVIVLCVLCVLCSVVCVV